jgi:hypothetical protein
MNAQVWLKGYPYDRIRNETKTHGAESLTSSTTIVNEIETVRTYRVGGSRGATIAKTSYFIMADVILMFLLVKEDVSLFELVNHVEEIDIDFKADANWLLLQVKQDLEQKGFVKSSLKYKSAYVSLMRKAFLKSEFRKTLILQMNEKSRIGYFF